MNVMNVMEMEFDFGELGVTKLQKYNYTNGRTALALVNHKTYEPIAMLTVNLPHLFLKSDEMFIKTWSENKQIIDTICIWFENTGRKVDTGFSEAEVWKIPEGAMNE